MTTIIIPDPCHILHKHAQDVADSVKACLSSGFAEQLRLYLEPTGTVVAIADTREVTTESSLVGTYTNEATAEEIAGDIIAAQREPIA